MQTHNCVACVTAGHIVLCASIRFRFSTVPSANSSSTISEEEVSKFSDWADTWWDVNGSFGALHSMNDLRVPLVRDALTTQAANEQQPNKPLQGISLLDVGCGGGILSEVFIAKQLPVYELFQFTVSPHY